MSDLCEAIHRRVLVQFVYDHATRTVEPYCSGISRREHRVLRAYQIEGGSTSREPFGWRLFDEEKILNLRVTDTLFEIRSEYDANDRAMIQILCRI